ITKKREVTLDRDKIRQCPKCDKEVLVRQFFDHENLIEMDQCWNCAGVWLDPGELLAIRKQYHTYEERKQAAQDYFSEQSKNISKFTKERIEYYKSSVDPDSIKSKDVNPDSGHSKDTKLTWEKVCRVITESLARRFLKGR
ncbi:MAG: zf-TFIIB domain-containing protein, partial [Candidatus Cloacimonetes bacterium]|nr:zf-TFIIB domain-containing protein [Candidatus Cloacimonadota bacterium]